MLIFFPDHQTSSLNNNPRRIASDSMILQQHEHYQQSETGVTFSFDTPHLPTPRARIKRRKDVRMRVEPSRS